MRLRGLQWNWRVTEPCVGRHQGRVTSPLYPPVAEVRTLGEQQCLGFHEPMEVHHLLTSDHLAGGKMVLCRPAFRIWGGRRLMSKLVNLGCDALWGASNVDFPFLSTCRDDDHLLEKWTMSANFAANLLPGLTRERRVAGARWGVGRMNGRLGQYRYHRSSNRQWRRDAAAHAAGVATEDQWYEYDGLYQVGEFQRGTLSGSYPNFSGITPVAQNQDWNYDAMGNWLGFQSDALNQTRQFNKVNEITSITGPSGVITPLYDPVGNMTTMPAVGSWTTAQTLKWDAWNRLVRVGEGSSTIAEYSYDALFRRVTKTVSGTTRHFSYSDQWQILEEYLGSAVNPEMRYWYGLRDINDMARRQRYGEVGISPVEDIYALREMVNVVALLTQVSGGDWMVVQRMRYDAFGEVAFMSGSWHGAPSFNSVGWNFLFHSQYRDAMTGLYQMRFRYYQPNLGVWLSQDPIGESNRFGLYCFSSNDPIGSHDDLGLQDTRASGDKRDCTWIIAAGHGMPWNPKRIADNKSCPGGEVYRILQANLENKPGNRGCVVSCFGNSINGNIINAIPNTPGTSRQLISDDFFPPTDPKKLANFDIRFDRAAIATLASAIDNAEKQAVIECEKLNCPCRTIYLKVVPSTSNRAGFSFAALGQRGEVVGAAETVNYKNTLDCRSLRWAGKLIVEQIGSLGSAGIRKKK